MILADTLVGVDFLAARETRSAIALSFARNDRDFDPFEQHLGLKVAR